MGGFKMKKKHIEQLNQLVKVIEAIADEIKVTKKKGCNAKHKELSNIAVNLYVIINDLENKK
jgi:hypothetical protein